MDSSPLHKVPGPCSLTSGFDPYPLGLRSPVSLCAGGTAGMSPSTSGTSLHIASLETRRAEAQGGGSLSGTLSHEVAQGDLNSRLLPWLFFFSTVFGSHARGGGLGKDVTGK